MDTNSTTIHRFKMKSNKISGTINKFVQYAETYKSKYVYLYSQNPAQMRKSLTILCLVTLVVLAACSKSKTTPEAGTGTNFKFSSLAAADTVIKVNDITTVTASATGDGLTYKWTASYGTFIGSGATVQWTVCHQDKFNISCQVTDQFNHSETKTVIVRTYN